MKHPGRRFSKFWLSLSAVPCVVLLLVTVAQAKRIQTLENLLAGSQNQGNLPEGLRLTGFRAHDLTGKEQTLAYGVPGSKPKLLYVFRPSCV
jgi:hypothetical protein